MSLTQLPLNPWTFHDIDILHIFMDKPTAIQFKTFFDSQDAILVNCKMSTGETCIIPKPEKISRTDLYKEEQGHQWISQMTDGFPVRQSLK